MATLQLLWNRFWWRTMQADTITYINNCHTYAVTKSFKQLPAGLRQPLPISRRAWSHIAIDFITDHPMSQGNTTILTVVDHFSKACWLIPLPKLPTALETFLRTSSLTGVPYLPLGSGQRSSSNSMLTWASLQGTIQSPTAIPNAWIRKLHVVQDALPSESNQLEAVFSLGWICSELSPQTCHWP